MITVNQVPAGTFNLVDRLNAAGSNIDIILYAVLGGVAVIFVTLAGVRYITSGGSADKAKVARQGIINAVIGVVIGMSAFAIIRLARLSTTVGADVATGKFVVTTPAPKPTKAPSGSNPRSDATPSYSGVGTYYQEAQRVLALYSLVPAYTDSAGKHPAKMCYLGDPTRCLAANADDAGVTNGAAFNDLDECIHFAETRNDIYSCVDTAANGGNTNHEEWICRAWEVDAFNHFLATNGDMDYPACPFKD